MTRCAGALLSLTLMVGCVSETQPRVVVRARSEALGPAGVVAMHRRHHERGDHVTVRCPVAMDDPGLVLARVGETAITACDIAIARAQRAQLGVAAGDLRVILRDLVDDALLAEAHDEGEPKMEPTVERTLAEAVIRTATREALEEHRPTAHELDRWVAEHPNSAVREPRVHLRQLVFSTLTEAQGAIRALREGTPFEELLARSIDPLARRDAGDLGLLTAEGASGVLPGVVAAGFTLTEAGSVADEPVPGGASVRPPREAGQRRRPRARRGSAWHVVQLLERIPEERIPDEELRRRAAERILRERYSATRCEVRERMMAERAEQVREAVSDAALASVRVRPGVCEVP